MPIKIQNDLPVKEILENENLFVVDENRAIHQDIRPLQLCILNLMPKKEETELQLLRMLSNTPLQIDVTFMRMSSHQSLNTPVSHLKKFYYTFAELKEQRFDGLIITGAPVEKIEYEDVDYWPELCEVFAWSKTNVFSTFHICWGAQAALYYHFGIPKVPLEKKLFGVFPHRAERKNYILLRGFDDVFMAPHSRHTTVRREDLENCGALKILASSEEAGVYAAITENGRQVFIMGHSEYDPRTLEKEYLRDKNAVLPITVPVNYYPNDDDTKEPLVTWRSHANLLYANWLNYMVYQTTPYDLNEISR